MTLTGAVDLDGGALGINTSSGNGAITITGAVTDTGSNSALTLTSGSGAVDLQSALGSTGTRVSSLAIVSSGQVDLNNVFTTGVINLGSATGNTDLNGTTYSSNDGAVTFGGAVDLGAGITIDSDAST